MTLSEIIILCSSGLALFIAIYFLTKSRFKPNLFLGLLLLMLSYQMFYNVLYWSNYNRQLLNQLYFSHLLPMSLYGPLFYLYIRTLVKNKGLKLLDLVHFIWPIIYLFTFWEFYALPYEIKSKALANGESFQYVNEIIPRYDWFLCLVMLTYLIVSFISFKKEIKDEKDLIVWFNVVHGLFCVFVLSFFAYYVLAYLNIISNEMDYFITYIMLVFISVTLYFCHQYPQIFNGKELNKVIPFVKYEKSGLSSSFSLELKEKLLSHMEKEKPYLDCDLRLNNLAKALNVSRNHMSQVINEHFDKSFFEFINQYRILEAIELLETNIDLSVTDVAFVSGFNNRVSFYNAFKKEKGITPTQFRKKINLAS